jgi:hypothetical protein
MQDLEVDQDDGNGRSARGRGKKKRIRENAINYDEEDPESGRGDRNNGKIDYRQADV